MTKSIRNLSIISGVIILSLGVVFLTGQLIPSPKWGDTPSLNNRSNNDAIESGQANFLENKINTNAASDEINITTNKRIKTNDPWYFTKTLTTDKTVTSSLLTIEYLLDFPVPNDTWHIGQGVLTQTEPDNISNGLSRLLSIQAVAKHWGTDTLGAALGFEGLAANQSTGTITHAIGVTGTIEQNAAGNIIIGKLFEGILGEPFLGTVGTLYGLYLPNINVATTNYAIYSAGGQSYHAGKFGIGVKNPKTKLEVDGIIKTIPMGSAICNADSEGGIYYDSDDKHFYGCVNGGSWVRLDN